MVFFDLDINFGFFFELFYFNVLDFIILMVSFFMKVVFDFVSWFNGRNLLIISVYFLLWVIKVVENVYNNLFYNKKEILV